MSRIAGGSLIISLVLAANSAASDLYVSNTQGNDRNDGRASLSSQKGSGPLETIAAALRRGQHGDQIIIHNSGEPYRESLTVMGERHSGGAQLPFVISGNGAVLDGSVPVPEGIWEHFRDDIFRFQPRRKTYLQLFYNDRPLVENRAASDALTPTKLQPLQWCLFDSHVYFRTERGQLPDQYELRQTGLPAGITLYRVHDLIVYDLILQGYHLDGVNAHDLNSNVRLSGLTCRGNGRSGIAVVGSSQVALDTCLVGNNGRAQVWIEAPAQVRVDNSELLGNTAPALVVRGGRVMVDGQPWSKAD